MSNSETHEREQEELTARHEAREARAIIARLLTHLEQSRGLWGDDEEADAAVHEAQNFLER